MYAVFRETTYPSGLSIEETPQFQEFQRAHANRPGYVGTVIAHAGDGRYLTVTLWDTAEHMDTARESIGPIAARLLNPLMTAPAILHGTGPVVVNDLVPAHGAREQRTDM